MKILQKILHLYNDSGLILRIVIGMALGAVLAFLVPGAAWIGTLGTLFVGALKAIAPILVVGVGFIIGVIQDSMETAINSSGDVLFTATAEYVLWKKQGRPLPSFLGGKKENG